MQLLKWHLQRSASVNPVRCPIYFLFEIILLQPIIIIEKEKLNFKNTNKKTPLILLLKLLSGGKWTRGWR